MSNTIGRLYRVTSFGESHGRCVGVVVDGCPAGHRLDLEQLQSELDRRRPGQSTVSTSRREEDRVEVLSGVFNGITTGAPICMLVWNRDRDSTGYEKRRWTPRPGHADYTAEKRYGGHQDYRGGGRFSGRITAGYVMAGALAKQVLTVTHGIEIMGYTRQIGPHKTPDVSIDQVRGNTEKSPVRCPDPETARAMERDILKVREEGDSLGGAVKCMVLSIPAGVGQPVFDTLEGDLAKALFSVPAVKAVEFGAGTALASMRGSESNDPFTVVGDRVETESNNMGGVLGGVSSGTPIEFTVTFKPTPSVSKPQQTVDLKTLEKTTLAVEGRHDPCIVPRAVPVVESVTAMVVLDHMIQGGHIGQVLGE